MTEDEYKKLYSKKTRISCKILEREYIIEKCSCKEVDCPGWQILKKDLKYAKIFSGGREDPQSE